jgi:hypothetical protein
MFELRNLRLQAAELDSDHEEEYTPSNFASSLHVSVERLVEIERTPIENLTVGEVAHYLDVLSLDIEVNATWSSSAPTELREGLVAERCLTLYDYCSVGVDAEALERGGEILRSVFRKKD